MNSLLGIGVGPLSNKEDYLHICLNSCHFDCTTMAEWKVVPLNWLTTSLVADVTPTDRPKSVRICWVIEPSDDIIFFIVLFCGCC